MSNEKEVFEEVLNHIFNVITNEEKVASEKAIQSIVNELSAENIKEMNPEEFNWRIGDKVNNRLYEIARVLSSTPNQNIKNKDKPIFIYVNYDFLEENIRNLCIKREGHSCCADKSREIIRMYMEYCLTEKVRLFNPNEEHYYTPNFGTNDDWINYCDGLYELYYGKPEKYIKTYYTLLQSEIRKYKHILHKWYIEFKDGEIIKFTNSWDDNISNPLENDYFDKGDFFIGNKKIFKHKGFEDYDNNKDRIINNQFCKIPKSTIKQIYKKSEEVMV